MQPTMLAWMAGAALPLIVHLLSKSRYQAVPWAAMMFLNADTAPWYHAAKLKKTVLLILRMATVGMIAIALARPVIASRYRAVPTAGLTTADRAAVVIILDDSASMGYEHDGKSRLDQGREVALQILSALKRGDEATLLLAGVRGKHPETPPNTDLQSIASRLTNLQPDTGQADFALELSRAADLLANNPATEREIYVICDHQACSWRNVTSGFKQNWHSSKTMPSITVFPMGGDQSDNLSVEAIDIPDDTFIRDQPTQLQVRVHNYGSTSRPSVPLTVWSGAKTIGQTQVAVAPRSTRSVNMTARFAEPGSRVVSAAIASTGLTSDDRLDVSVDVIERYRVLVLKDAPAASRPATEPSTQSTPPIAGRRGEISVISIAETANWSPEYIRQFDVLVMDDISEFTEEHAKIMRDFLATGRGILFLPGSHSNIESYNRTLFKAGHAIMPAMLRPLVEKTIGFGNVNRQHPIFRIVGLRPESIPSYFPLGQHQQGSRVVSRFLTGEPWCIESTALRGRVVLLAGGESFMQSHEGEPLLQSIVHYLGGGTAIDRNLSPGQPIVAEIDQRIDERSATVQSPSAAVRESAIVNQSSNHAEIRYVKTLNPSTYRLRYRADGKEKILNYVVSIPHEDSDLTPMTEIQWQKLDDGIRLEKIDLSKTTVAKSMELQRGGREIWIDLLSIVLLLMVIEMLLSHVWST